MKASEALKQVYSAYTRSVHAVMVVLLVSVNLTVYTPTVGPNRPNPRTLLSTQPVAAAVVPVVEPWRRTAPPVLLVTFTVTAKGAPTIGLLRGSCRHSWKGPADTNVSDCLLREVGVRVK